MTNHRLELDRYRRKYRELVEAREFEKAVDVLTDVGKLYYAMAKDKQLIPAHFLDPGDDLL